MGAIFLVTGEPGTGKSTVVSKVVLRLRSRGVIVGGCVTSEVRSHGERTGFAIENLTDGTRGTLAAVSGVLGPRVGRYRVSLQDLSSVAARSVNDATSKSELVVIDELGPMELVSPDFRRAVESCMASPKPILAVVHHSMQDDLLERLRKSADTVFTVTVMNREDVVEDLFALLAGRLTAPKPS